MQNRINLFFGGKIVLVLYVLLYKGIYQQDIASVYLAGICYLGCGLISAIQFLRRGYMSGVSAIGGAFIVVLIWPFTDYFERSSAKK